ncbi:MAG: PP2C family serine/threonine-protein phosphatase [Anaerolineae bacterium]
MLTTINQNTDTPARREGVPGAVLTYLYDRSRDSKKSSQPGQDFICFRVDEDNNRFAFCVCDGVSQSFYGDIAARFLGEKLCNWLYEYDPPPSAPDVFTEALDAALTNWTDEASTLVQEKEITASLPPMVRDALERKREVGSETMFLGGIVDFAEGMFYACWMGDLRLWLWDSKAKSIPFDGLWETKLRWSTRYGAKNGKPHVLILSLKGIARITAHTDGLGSRTPGLEDILANVLAGNSLHKLNSLASDLMESPTSDDVAVLDIALDSTADSRAVPVFVPLPIQLDLEETTVIWDEIPDATGYRVSVQQGGRQWTIDTTTNTFFLPADSIDTVIRVRALGHEQHGPWSGPLTIQPPSMPDAVRYGVGDSEVVVVTASPFRLRRVIAISLVLALLISLGWIVLTYVR